MGGGGGGDGGLWGWGLRTERWRGGEEIEKGGKSALVWSGLLRIWQMAETQN